jgi:hypothetical protein
MVDRNTEFVPTEGANINPPDNQRKPAPPLYIHTYIHTYKHICIYTHICMYIHIPTHTNTHLGSAAFAVHLEKERGPFSETVFPFRISYKARDKS